MPVPPIYLRMIPGTQPNRPIHEVVDGQQRIRSVLDYIDGKFRLGRTLVGDWRGKTFEQLGTKNQQQVSSFGFSAEVFKGISDQDVLAVFARLNTYSVPLNPQELRNGKFFGFFKNTSYCLAHEHLEFWRRHKIFNEQSIARMLEVELTSELLIAGHVGMQDKKKTIDHYYKEYENEYSDRVKDEQRFRTTIDEIAQTFNGDLRETEFNRPPFFYTLYCVVHHHLYSLPGEKRSTPKKRLTKDDRDSLREAVASLSQIISEARDKQPVPRKYGPFVIACLSQTDNIKPRRTRFEYLFDEAF
jgi:hypothetical protein